jgi:hypothetical protein
MGGLVPSPESTPSALELVALILVHLLFRPDDPLKTLLNVGRSGKEPKVTAGLGAQNT